MKNVSRYTLKVLLRNNSILKMHNISVSFLTIFQGSGKHAKNRKSFDRKRQGKLVTKIKVLKNFTAILLEICMQNKNKCILLTNLDSNFI